MGGRGRGRKLGDGDVEKGGEVRGRCGSYVEVEVEWHVKNGEYKNKTLARKNCEKRPPIRGAEKQTETRSIKAGEKTHFI